MPTARRTREHARGAADTAADAATPAAVPAVPAAPRIAADEVVLGDGVLRLENWLPFEFSTTTNRVSAALAHVYADRFGLSVAGWRVIAVLAEHAPCSASEVAAHLATTPVVVTRTVAELLAKRMVTRKVDAADRRRIELRLAAAGTRVYRTVMPHARRIEAALLAGLTTGEIATLRRLMARVVEGARAL